MRIYNNANDNKDDLIRELQKTASDKDNFLELKRRYHNEKLTEFVENNNELDKIIEYKGKLYQKMDPIYLDPESGFIKAHFYAPRKMVFGELLQHLCGKRNHHLVFYTDALPDLIFQAA